jgi:ComF family protein
MVVAGRLDHAFQCADCHAAPPAYDQARSLFQYEGGIREAIHALKYLRDLSVIPDLARLLLAGLKTHYPLPESWTLAPVPLHRRRLAERGFNQSDEIIRAVCRLDPKVRSWRGLRRVKFTESQTKLTKAGRRENVVGAFAVGNQVAPAAVILVDDVMTTGATLNACASVLKRKAGVTQVFTLTLARG